MSDHTGVIGTGTIVSFGCWTALRSGVACSTRGGSLAEMVGTVISVRCCARETVVWDAMILAAFSVIALKIGLPGTNSLAEIKHVGQDQSGAL